MADAGPGGGLALLGLGTYVTLRRPTTEFDTLQYHFPDAVHWLQSHAIWTLPVLSAPYADNAYPSNAELLSSWLMQPAHASNLARLPPLAFGVLAVLGAALLARNLKSPAWLGALGGLVVVASPIFYLNVDTLMTDLAGPARGGPVLELGVPNVAQLFGPHLRRRIATVGAGPDGNREPDRALFLRYLDTHHPAAIVISPLPMSVDPGYLAALRPPPQTWSLVGQIPEIGGSADAVYLPRIMTSHEPGHVR